jgi:hypothetical protein
VVTHDEYLGSTVLCGFLVELQRPMIEPTGAGLLIVVEAEPDVLEPADLRVVPTPAQIDDVGYPKGPKLFGMAPRGNRATECQPLANEKDFQLNRLFSLSSKSPRRLENSYFVNASTPSLGPIKSVTCSPLTDRDF